MHDRIKEIRLAMGMTQQAFADELGLKRNSIAAIESGSRTPSAPTMHSLIREFHVNEEWLRTGNGEMFVQKSRVQEIAQYAASLTMNPDSFQSAVIEAMAKLPPEAWSEIERFVTELVEKNKKEKAQE